MGLGLAHGFSRLVFWGQSGGGVSGEVDLELNAGGVGLPPGFYLFDLEGVDVDSVSTGHISVLDQQFLDGVGCQGLFGQCLFFLAAQAAKGQ